MTTHAILLAIASKMLPAHRGRRFNDAGVLDEVLDTLEREPPMSNEVYITSDGGAFHKSKGCIHLRYARRRATLVFVPRRLASEFTKPCKTCYKKEN